MKTEQSVNIYVITTGNTERQARVEKFLEGFEFEYVNSLPYDELERLEKRYRGLSHRFRQKAMMAGEIGAFNTHSKAWSLVEQSKKPAIIIEDNVEFIKDAKGLLDKQIVDMIEGCGFVSLNEYQYKLFPDKPFIISSIPEKKPVPIVCYGLTPSRARNLLSYMSKTGYSVPVDRWLSIPRLCGIYSYISPIRFTMRASKDAVASIANKRKGTKTYNPINMVFWVINRLKYDY